MSLTRAHFAVVLEVYELYFAEDRPMSCHKILCNFEDFSVQGNIFEIIYCIKMIWCDIVVSVLEGFKLHAKSDHIK